MPLKLKSGPARNFAASFARNKKTYRKANGVAGRAARKVRARVSGGTPGRTGKVAGHVAYAGFKAKRTVGMVGHGIGRAANSHGGRTILSAAASIGVNAVVQRRNSNHARAKGYTEKQIGTAKGNAARKHVGSFRIMGGAALTHIGGTAIGKSKIRHGNIIAAGLFGAGLALGASGQRANNKHVNKVLAGMKPGGKPTAKATGHKRQVGGIHKVARMSRSQAASIAAKARWSGRRRRPSR